MHRLPANPLISKGLELAERKLGMTELSVRLGSPAGTVNAWRSGDSAMPEHKFRLLIDLLLEIDPTWMDE